jgi:nitrate/nitrite-specific signal transduction histidine kinase
MNTRINLLLLTLFFSISASSQNLSLGSALNKAGKQRMLTQRMAKDYLLIGSGIKLEEASRDIDESISVFEEQHIALVGYAPNVEVTQALAIVNSLWSKFRIKVATTPDVNEASALINDATVLMNACNVVVEKIQEFGEVKTAKLTNVSGRQRMLSQRLALLYTAYYWKVPFPNLIKIFELTESEFEENLKYLSTESEKYPEIAEILAKTKSMWAFSKTGFDLKSNKLMPSVIFVTTNTMTNEFNEITKFYERITQK